MQRDRGPNTPRPDQAIEKRFEWWGGPALVLDSNGTHIEEDCSRLLPAGLR